MKLKLITRQGLIRLALLAILLGCGCGYLYWRMIRMPLKSHRGPLPPLSAKQKALSEQLRRDVTVLASTVGERNIFRPGTLKRAAAYLSERLEGAGYLVKRETYEVSGESCDNLIVELPSRSGQIVLVGAHYDSVSGSPGANDNASGVAALLALAENFRGKPCARTIRFVAFVNEEPPHFQTAFMGSAVNARRARAAGDQIVAMVSLETLGYYDDRKGSQKYPAGLGLLYPSEGNFVGFVGNPKSRALVRASIAAFRKGTAFPSEGAALPGNLAGVGWSDHWAFWEEGFAAIMVTDTAIFRYPYYHTEQDTPDKIDFDRLARVTEGLEHVLLALANPNAQ